MRRHSGLIPLSHEHHDVLVVAQGLIRGRSPAPRSDWPPRREDQVARVVAFFDQVLQPHFGFEESVLFPLAERKMHRSAELVESLVREHDEVRSRLGTLRSDPKHDLDLRLPALGRLLAAHVRREERDLFEGLQRELDEAALDAIGVQLRARPASGPSCQPRHP